MCVVDVAAYFAQGFRGEVTLPLLKNISVTLPASLLRISFTATSSLVETSSLARHSSNCSGNILVDGYVGHKQRHLRSTVRAVRPLPKARQLLLPRLRRSFLCGL